MRRVEFTVGVGYDSKGNVIPPETIERLIPETLESVAHRFGGYTVTKGMGGWIDPNGKLIQKPNITILTYSDVDDRGVDRTAEYLRRIFGQTSVLVVVSQAEVRFIEEGKV